MASTKSPHGVDTKVVAYENFMGLDTSRDRVNQDTQQEQHLSLIENATCDWRGQIVRDPSASFKEGMNKVKHVRHFGENELAWAEQTGAGIDLTTSRDHTKAGVYPTNATVTSTIFNQQAHFFVRALPAHFYDGVLWKVNSSPALATLNPQFATTVQRRLAVAGIAGKETQVHLSRVDNGQIFPDDEDPDSTDVLRAGFIDVGNQIGSADKITGLSSFEQDKLVIFTADRALIYGIDPSILLWQIDTRTNIHIGCISHNTIVSAGTDVLFCSRSGVHSIQRSTENGSLVFSSSMSDKIDLLYREYFASVEDPQSIAAVWDQDEAQYHIFFPQPGDTNIKRLTLSTNPEGEAPVPKWSTGNFLNSRCGSFLSGQLALGTPGGVYTVNKTESTEGYTPDLSILTPILWHGDLIGTKQTPSLILQPHGQSVVTISATDDLGRDLGSITFEVDDTDDNRFFGVPISSQYERKWETRYRGAQYKIVSDGGSGTFRITGFAVVIRK